VVGVLEIAIFVPNRATKVQTEAKTDQGKPTTRFHLATRVLEPKSSALLLTEPPMGQEAKNPTDFDFVRTFSKSSPPNR
jgi:hypothetical protein